jgi:UDP-glucose 4-epimerase
MARILCTGGCGFIGTHTVQTLVDNGHEVMVVDNFASSERRKMPWDGRATVVEQDICSDEFFLTVEAFKPEAICHLAAQASLLRSVQEPIYDAKVNILGTLQVIDAAREVGARVVMATTSAVYDETARPPYREDSPDTPVKPNRPYGISKRSAEMYLSNSGLSYALLRYGNVYGPGQVPVGENQVVPRALRHIYLGDEFILNGSGEQTRDFIYVKDVAEANRIALTQPEAFRRDLNFYTGTFNIATGVPTSINTVLANLCALTGRSVAWKHGPAKPNEPFHVWLATDKAGQHFGWRAWTRMEDGLRETVEAFKAKHQVS